jgi:dolichol-phosphate mannosyltransferase
LVSLNKITKSFEIIFVNDGSPDTSWKLVSDLSRKNRSVIGINLSRNFGQHHAITAGIDYAKGDWIIVMDGDLQDDPEYIEKLYVKACEGYDIVFAKRISRTGGIVKLLSSGLFRTFFRFLTGIDLHLSIGNYSIASRRAIQAVRSIKEQHRWYLQNLKWIGFPTATVDVRHAKRYSGSTSYSWGKLLSLALDIVLAYTDKPLKLSVYVGLSIATISMCYGLFMIWRWFFARVPLLGYTSIIVALFFFAGLVMTNLGIVGLYIGRIFEETKKKPLYIIKEITNAKPRIVYDKNHGIP